MTRTHIHNVTSMTMTAEEKDLNGRQYHVISIDVEDVDGHCSTVNFFTHNLDCLFDILGSHLKLTE